MTKVIGLTGGIATGKSTVTTMLRKKGYPVIDADAVVHRLQAPGGILYEAIVAHFGPDYLQVDGSLDRQKLASLIFSDDRAKTQLSQIQDDLIRQALEDAKQAYIAQGEPVVFMDIPLLFERDYQGFDAIWVVYAPQDLQLARLMARNGLSELDAQKILDAQWPIDRKVKLADHVIENCDKLELLEQVVDQVLGTL